MAASPMSIWPDVSACRRHLAREAQFLGAALGDGAELVLGLLELGLGVEVFGGGDAEDLAVGEEGVMARISLQAGFAWDG